MPERPRRRARRLHPALLLGLVGCLLLTGCVDANASSLHFTSVPASDASFPNPERGWFDSFDLLGSPTLTSQKADHVTLLHSYIELDPYRDSALPAAVLATLRQNLAAVRAAHMKTVVRVAYNQGPYPNSAPDASLDTIRTHLAQLKPVLAANVDVILSFEAGFVGAWGEWHSSTHGYDTDANVKATVYRLVMSTFPRSRMVALRYPSDIRALVGAPVTASGAYSGSDAARTGNHEDCLLSGGSDDQGTFGRDHVHSVASDKSLVAAQGRYTVVGGEICADSDRVTCPAALSELAALHFTYLNRQFQSGALARLRAGGCADEIGDRLGYRFVLERFGVSPAVHRGGTLTMSMTVRNDGFANLVNARPVYLVLSRGSKHVPIRLTVDPRRWSAGAGTTAEQTVTLPASVGKGTWSVALWLPDAAPGLQHQAAYSVRFANADTWDAANGRNRVPISVVVG